MIKKLFRKIGRKRRLKRNLIKAKKYLLTLELRDGICYAINELYYRNKISYWQRYELFKFIESNEPEESKISENSYWWAQNQIGRDCRIGFLNKLIEKL